MPYQGWSECLSSMSGAGPALASFTTAVSCITSAARKTMPPDYWQLGDKATQLRIKASGGVSNVVTAQPTFTFEFRLGPTSNIAVFTTGAVLTSTTAHTLVPWWLDINLTLRAKGSGTSANFIGQALLASRAFIDAGATADITTLGHPTLLAPETSPAVGTGFDSTVANVADLFVACSVSNAANAITCHQYSLDIN